VYALNGRGRFNTTCTIACLNPTSANWIQSALSHPMFLRPILIFSFHVRLVISSCLFLLGFQLIFAVHFLVSLRDSSRALNRPNTHKEYEIWRSSSCNFLSSLMGLNTFCGSQLVCCPLQTGFSRWYVLFRITGSGILKNITFRGLDLFPFSGDGVGDTPLGLLEWGNLNCWTISAQFQIGSVNCYWSSSVY
jgi:hypothetical protein